MQKILFLLLQQCLAKLWARAFSNGILVLPRLFSLV